MSRISRLLPRFLLKASFVRAFGETLLLFMLLTLVTILIYQINVGTIAITSLIFFINPCAALYFSLRLRIPDGRWYRRIGLDVLWIAIPALLFNPLIWLLTRISLLNVSIYGSQARVFDALFIGLLAFSYVFFRVAVRFIVWSHFLRQRRIIWSLVSGNLLAVALFQALIGVPLTALFLFNLGNSSLLDIPDNPLAQSFYRFQLSLPLVGVVILVATAVLIALLPVSIAVSYFFARGMRHRLDVLLEAAHAARDGNYDTQIAISGQDEIARLQADFNVMTANLKINVDELRDEREKVATLLKTRRELMANVSHELRTPIATVRAYLDSALRQQTNTSDVTLSQNDVAIIQRETLRLQTLIDDLFALSRAEVDQLAVKLLPVDSISLIQRVIETVLPLAWNMNRVEIVGNLPASFPQIVADEARLEQVLRNLIHNSLRYTPPGGLVIISMAENDGDATIQIQDTGEGIPAEHLPHIWERYYRDAENGGTGLGLALVKSFVAAMHGQVAVTSIPGEGASFTIRLPLAKPIPEPNATPLAVDIPTLHP
jgi:signal transduction histidine kinase